LGIGFRRVVQRLPHRLDRVGLARGRILAGLFDGVALVVAQRAPQPSFLMRDEFAGLHARVIPRPRETWATRPGAVRFGKGRPSSGPSVGPPETGHTALRQSATPGIGALPGDKRPRAPKGARRVFGPDAVYSAANR